MTGVKKNSAPRSCANWNGGCLLTVLDRKWREHLYEMDYLREGIGLRAMAQRDPLVEYQREGGDMFNAMMEAFMEEVVGFVFHLDVEVEQAPAVGVVTDGAGQPLTIGAVSTNGEGRHDGSPQQRQRQAGGSAGVPTHRIRT